MIKLAAAALSIALLSSIPGSPDASARLPVPHQVPLGSLCQTLHLPWCD